MRKLIIANWKMNPSSLEEARVLVQSVEHRFHFLGPKVSVAICPPTIFIPALSHFVHRAILGAQNLCFAESGAFTGEVSAKQLLLFGVQIAILGHSERRLNFGEDDEMVNNKIKVCLKNKIEPVVCLGGDPKAKMSGMKKIVLKQFNAAVTDLDEKQVSKIIWTYEPFWAISTMKNSKPETGEHAAKMIGYLRGLLAKKIGKTLAKNTLILYGGSVNKSNVHEFAKFPEIDGALVGAASLNADNFWEVIKEFNRESVHKA